MIVELGAALLAICAVGYAIHRCGERARWVRLREVQLERLKRLKEKMGGK